MIRPVHLKGMLALGMMGFAGALLWFGMATDQADWYVPVRIENVPSGLVAIRSLFKGIDIQVRGPRAVIRAHSDLKLAYPLDLAGTKPGIQQVKVDPKLIKLPRGLAIQGVNPSRFSVKIENEVNKMLPVRIALQGEPAPGFTITGAFVRPESVVLTGPESVLAPLMEVKTKPVVLSGLAESFRKEISLDLAEGLEVISASRLATVEVAIAERVTTRKIENVPVVVKNNRFQYRISPAAAGVVIKGPARLLARLDAARDISVVLDLEALLPGNHTQSASISLPVQTTLISVEPEKFQIFLLAP